MTTRTESAIDVSAGPALPARAAPRRPEARREATQWPATYQDRDVLFGSLTDPPFVVASPGSQKQRRRGVALLLDWLASYPGQTWQDRWLSSGADTAGRHWRDIPAGWLRGQGGPCSNATVNALCAALPVAISADVLRPGIDWFVRAVPRGGALARTMAQTRDVDGFALLRSACDEDAQLPTGASEHTRHRAAILIGHKGGNISAITVGDVVALSPPRPTPTDGPWITPSRSTEPCTAWVSSARTRPRPCNRCAAPGSCPANSSSTVTRLLAGRSEICSWTTCGNGSRRWTTAA